MGEGRDIHPLMLSSEEKLARRMADVFGSREPPDSSIDPVVVLQGACSGAGTARAWALQHRISPAYVCDVLQGRREPGRKMLDALGLERVVIYRPTPSKDKADG